MLLPPPIVFHFGSCHFLLFLLPSLPFVRVVPIKLMCAWDILALAFSVLQYLAISAKGGILPTRAAYSACGGLSHFVAMPRLQHQVSTFSRLLTNNIPTLLMNYDRTRMVHSFHHHHHQQYTLANSISVRLFDGSPIISLTATNNQHFSSVPYDRAASFTT